MAKKPKAVRGHYSPDLFVVYMALNRNHKTLADNCTVIPDGASVPLPASVRRCVKVLRLILEKGDLDWRDGIGPRTLRKIAARKAVEAYERAMGRGGK